ncbi:MAG: hypothetical protein L0Z53_25295, partial [Acidobacteriales bacterium]|nr:hypothetical protein [Terriglobales bacterium]
VEPFREALAVSNSGSLFSPFVLCDQTAFFSGEPVKAILHAVLELGLPLSGCPAHYLPWKTFGPLSHRDQCVQGLWLLFELAPVLLQHMTRDSRKIGVEVVDRFTFIYFSGSAVDGFISQTGGIGTVVPFEEPDEPLPHPLILFSSPVAVRI